jgi:hypothetical protein
MTKQQIKEVKVVNEGESKEVSNFIASAIEKGLPVETMEKLFALREKVKAEYAKEEFMRAMANFQKDCPIIEKKNAVKNKSGQVVYHFANLGDIVEQVKKPLGDNELSYDFVTEDLKDFLKVTCVVTHSLGHSKSSSFQIPIGTEAYMTDVQKYGARLTFAKRYAFCNALGILTNDEDIDAKENQKVNISKEIVEQVEKCTTEDELKKVWEANKGLGKEFAKLVTEQKEFIKGVKEQENA